MERHWIALDSESEREEPSPELKRQLLLRAFVCRELAKGHPELEATLAGTRVPENAAERALCVVWRAHEYPKEDWVPAWRAMELVARKRGLI